MHIDPVVRFTATLALASVGAAQTTSLASVDSAGNQADGTSYSPPAISADGSAVAFSSVASNFVAGDAFWTMDIFVHELSDGLTTCVSVTPAGKLANDHSSGPSISADGRFVAFTSLASNLVSGDANNKADVFVRDRLTGVTSMVSLTSQGLQANEGCFDATISADGRYVAFNSMATNLVPGDTNDALDAFVHDRATGKTWRASVDSAGLEGDDSSYTPRISAGGGHVTFYSYATNLVPGDTNGYVDVFVHELATGLTERVSVGAGGEEANEKSWAGGLSADGRYVTFTSFASNLVPGDTNGVTDVFVKDRVTGEIVRASTDSGGSQADSHSEDASLSGDGRHVTFVSMASNLVADDTNDGWDVFVKDLLTGEMIRASVHSDGTQADDLSFGPRLSADGERVVFQSWATNLVDGDVNGYEDIFVRDRAWVEIGESYCGPANLNSTGQSAVIAGYGSTRVTDNHLVLEARQLPQDQWGYFLNSDVQGFVANPSGSQGNLCLGGGIGRHQKQLASSGAAGEIQITVDLTALPRPGGQHAVLAGEVWHFQCWYRDKNPTQTSNFTDGLSVAFD